MNEDIAHDLFTYVTEFKMAEASVDASHPSAEAYGKSVQDLQFLVGKRMELWNTEIEMMMSSETNDTVKRLAAFARIEKHIQDTGFDTQVDPEKTADLCVEFIQGTAETSIEQLLHTDAKLAVVQGMFTSLCETGNPNTAWFTHMNKYIAFLGVSVKIDITSDTYITMNVFNKEGDLIFSQIHQKP